ncbi:hypothetical protein ACHAXR_003334 [Thalassiosira sp. AJA248-18]
MKKPSQHQRPAAQRRTPTILIILNFVGIGLLLNGSFGARFYLNSLQALQGGTTNVPLVAVGGNHDTSLLLDGMDCSKLLRQFRAGEIEIAKKEGEVNFRRSFVALSKGTPQSFYVATHDKGIDSVRADIMQYQFYYEKELSEIIAGVFKKMKNEGKESIMLDVGSNIGWFSLVAAAHGATKVYAFEPNLQNTIRFCESLSLNGWLARDFVIPVSKGVGKVEETRELYAVDKNNPGTFTFQKGGGDVVGKMEITTLDVFAESHGWFDSKPSIGFFKLDVERFECEVIEGAKRLLNSRIIETIAMELKPDHSEDAKSTIVQLLFDAGYEFVMHGAWMGPNTKVLTKYNHSSELVKDFQAGKYKENVLFRLKGLAGIGNSSNHTLTS